MCKSFNKPSSVILFTEVTVILQDAANAVFTRAMQISLKDSHLVSYVVI